MHHRAKLEPSAERRRISHRRARPHHPQSQQPGTTCVPIKPTAQVEISVDEDIVIKSRGVAKENVALQFGLWNLFLESDCHVLLAEST